MKHTLTLLTALLLVPLAALQAAGGGSRLEPFEPANGEKLINYHPHFQWRGPEMTLDYQPECEIQIATEPEFKKLLATDVIGGGMNRFYSMVSLTAQREYFWRVRIQKPEIGPWSETFHFTVVAPDKQFTIAKGSDSAAVLDTLREAASTSKAGHTVEVIFEKGDYRVGPVKDRFDFRIHDVPGFRIEGNDSSITLVGDSFFAEVTGSRNVEIRRLTMKWDQPGHVMMEVTKVLTDTREVEAAILPEYPLKDLEFFWPVGGGNTFLIRVDPKFPGKYTGGIKARTRRQMLSEGSYRIGPIEEREFKNWQIGDRLAATHYRGGFIQNHDNDKLVLKDITFVDAPGAISGNGGRNDKVAYLNLKVMPDPRFPDSRLAGHASSEGGRVAAWMEGCEFNMLGDDNYNSGYFADYELLRQHDEQTLTMKIQPWDELIFPGDRLRFADQKTNRGIGEAIAVSVDNSVRDEVKVVLDRKLPQLPASTIASNNQGNQRYVYRNNRQRGGRGHGLKFKGYGTLIENNVFENIAGIGIYLGCPEGAPRARSADMATVRRNTITLCGWHSIEAGQVAAPSERIRIEDNVIRDSKTAGIFLLNVHGSLVRGNTFESLTSYFAPTDTYPSVVLKDCTDILVSGEVLKDIRVKAVAENTAPFTHRVASESAASKTSPSFLDGSPGRGVYGATAIPEDKIPAHAPERTHWSESPLVMHFTDLDPALHYEVELCFLASKPTKEVRILAGFETIEPKLSLPSGEIVKRHWTLPMASYADGILRLELRSGYPGPSLASVEIFASEPTAKPLKPRSQDALWVPSVFGDHMVLQRRAPVPIWGHSAPGEEITVTFAGQSHKTKAGADGKWRLDLPALEAGGPFEMTVSGAKSRVVFNDVLVGEVWLASGQSNMQWTFCHGFTGAEAELTRADAPRVRFLCVPHLAANKLQDDVLARWVPCNRESLLAGGESGAPSVVAYGFARELEQKLNVPVGILNSSLGGSAVEPWMPHSWLAKPMIHPLAPYGIRGWIWYQGESNLLNGETTAYTEKQKRLITEWRQIWGEGDFPFYFVQLAPHRYSTTTRRVTLLHDSLPRFWEAQAATLSLPNTGMVVISDLVDRDKLDDIHPRNKLPVGRRLAQMALARTYEMKNGVDSGPTFASMSISGSSARISFRDTGSGLATRDGKAPDWFTIAAADGKFEQAEARIEGDDVFVSSPKIANPTAVRFAWDECAQPNLMNKEGLPASPFRTDKFPGLKEKNK